MGRRTHDDAVDIDFWWLFKRKEDAPGRPFRRCASKRRSRTRRAAQSSRSAADALAQEERGPVKRLTGLIEYAEE
jgi:hypothetical protein